jgi:fructose-1-phosphate kinase PfkB-like protein
MIVVPALHPARELLVRVDALRPGAVHRAIETIDTVGGKPINVARFVRLMGRDVRLLARVDSPLRDALLADPVLGAAAGVELIPSAVPSRTDVAVVDARGGTTPINGTAPAAPPAEVEAVVGRTLDRLVAGDVLVLAGSQPPGADGVLARVIGEASRRAAVVVVDASGPWLREALAARPRMVKINRDETAGVDLDAVPVLAISDGPNGITARIDGRSWRIVAPPIAPIASTLGAGDAVTAGLAIGLAAGRPPLDGLRLGAAMAAARLRHLEATLDPAEVVRWEREITVQHVD